MSSYERYDNGDASSDHNPSPPHKTSSDFSSQYDLRDYLRSSRSKERERGEGRDRRVRDGDYERRHRDHRSGRKEGGRNGDYDDGYYDTRDYERHSDRDSKRRHGRRSRSRSRSRSHRSRSRSKSHRSRSRSLSTSNSKRTSRFDVGPPPGSVVLNGVIATAGPIMQPFATALPMMSVQATRHARRVYVGGLSPTANEQSVATFFSQVMSKIGGNTAGSGDAVINVYINHDKKFAFVEMRSVEEASNAMALNGILFEGAPVKVKRPTDYNPTLAAALGPSHPNPNLNLAAVGISSGSAGVPEGPDRIFVGGLPYYFTEEQIRELLESFGKLRGFDLVKDRETGNSKGYAFCVYDNVSVTDIACGALNGLTLGDKTLTVRRANQGTSHSNPEQENILLHAKQQVAFQKMLLQGGTGALPTKVVCLTHAVSADELTDDEEYENIMEDMREGARYGTLVNVVIPRPKGNGESSPGVGKVFLEYADIDGASKAKAGLDGRKFGENQVVASFYPEDKFAHGDYDE